MIRAALPLLCLLAAACSEEPSAPTAQGAEAAGEVLGGSISDAMIPLDQLRSEAPLLPRQNAVPGQPSGEEAETAPDGEAEAASEGAEAAPAAPAPEVPAEE